MAHGGAGPGRPSPRIAVTATPAAGFFNTGRQERTVLCFASCDTQERYRAVIYSATGFPYQEIAPLNRPARAQPLPQRRVARCHQLHGCGRRHHQRRRGRYPPGIPPPGHSAPRVPAAPSRAHDRRLPRRLPHPVQPLPRVPSLLVPPRLSPSSSLRRRSREKAGSRGGSPAPGGANVRAHGGSTSRSGGHAM